MSYRPGCSIQRYSPTVLAKWHSRPRLRRSLVQLTHRRICHIFQIDVAPILVSFRTFQQFIPPPEARDLVFQYCRHNYIRLLRMHSFVVMPYT